jgi:selenium metabolism protein YedF
MSEQTIDARGMLCPRPLMMVKKTLEQVEVGTCLVVLLDNDMACSNVNRFLQDNGAAPVVTQEGEAITIRAQKTQTGLAAPDAAAYCAPTGLGHTGPTVMVFTHNGMGQGSEELGWILVQACINALPEMTPRPQVLVFYNSAVQLTVEGSPVLDSLRQLQADGATLLVCGTCLDFFQLKDHLRVGTISNMYEILEHLARADKVIYP